MTGLDELAARVAVLEPWDGRADAKANQTNMRRLIGSKMAMTPMVELGAARQVDGVVEHMFCLGKDEGACRSALALWVGDAVPVFIAVVKPGDEAAFIERAKAVMP